MGNPLRLKETVGSTFLGLQEMQDAEMDYAVHQVLTEFSVSLTASGTININGDGTDAGSFSDTTRTEVVGFHPSQNAISTSTYTLKQNLTSTSESSIVYPLFVDDNGYAAEHSNNLSSTIISRALSNLVSNGLGSYWLSEVNPNASLYSDSGYSVTDTNKQGTTVYKLWRKDQGVSSPSVTRPVRLNSSSIQEMSDAEIKTLAARLRNQIVDTGIGTYRLASTNPAAPGETWVLVSDDVTDTRNTISSQQYAATYVGAFDKTYSGAYIGIYEKAYNKQYEGAFTKQYEKTYVGAYTGQYTKTYVGQYEGTFTGNYTKQYEGSFVAQYTGAFEGVYVGVYTKQYQGQYVGTYLKSYVGQYSRQFEGAFNKQYEGTFTGYFSDTY